MKPLKDYIFDFDGTLMDTAPVILATMRGTIADLGLPERSEAEMKATIGLRLDEIPRVLFPDSNLKSETYVETYRKLFPKFNKPGIVKPYPGVIETLKQLHAEGKNLAIASSRSHASLQEFTDNMGLTAMFAILIGGDDVEKGKPDPEPVLTILSQQDWNADESLVVGDANVDILMGNSAGCRTCAVTYGNGTRAELEAAEPFAIIDSFSEILKL